MNYDEEKFWTDRAKRHEIEEQKNYYPERVGNNPNAEPCGHFTGRCSKCGSKNLWTDNLHYGCNACGTWLA